MWRRANWRSLLKGQWGYSALRRGLSPTGYFFRGEKVSKTPLKGRGCFDSPSPPENPHTRNDILEGGSALAQATLSWPSANSPCLGRGPTPRVAVLQLVPHHELLCVVVFVNGTYTHHRTTAPRFISGCGKQGLECNMARAGRRTDERWFLVGEALPKTASRSDATHEPRSEREVRNQRGFGGALVTLSPRTK